MHRAGCEEVNYNPAHGWTEGWGWGREGERELLAPGPGGRWGMGAASHVPWVHGATRGLWARSDAWGPRALILLIWPQIAPGLLALLRHGMLQQGLAVSHSWWCWCFTHRWLVRIWDSLVQGLPWGSGFPPAPATGQNSFVGGSMGGLWPRTRTEGKLRHGGGRGLFCCTWWGGRAPEHDPPAALPSAAIRLFPNVRRMFAGSSWPARGEWRGWGLQHGLGQPPASHGWALVQTPAVPWAVYPTQHRDVRLYPCWNACSREGTACAHPTYGNGLHPPRVRGNTQLWTPRLGDILVVPAPARCLCRSHG